jgi:23S rRNA pseudouridine955/2504/2580 synthase
VKKIDLLYEDENYFVFNKPPGLPVQGGKGVGISLDSLLSQNYKPRPLLVHRLDKDTSGVMVTAKNKQSAAAIAVLFLQGSALKKRYHALCSGLAGQGGKITEPLLIKGREQRAETLFTRLGVSGEISGIAEKETDSVKIRFSLLELEPATGRMHQIRRHLAQIGHPILGDDRYGDFALNKFLKKNFGLKGMLLHAASLSIPDPLIKGGKEISAPLPDYFRNFLNAIGMDADGMDASCVATDGRSR